MEIFKNVSVYLDDLEIIEVLRTIPSLPETNNQTLLKYLEVDSRSKNLAITMIFDEKVYTVMKFDMANYNPKDAGLILMISDPIFATKQIEFIQFYKEKGGSLSHKILNAIIDQLNVIQSEAIFADHLRQKP